MWIAGQDNLLLNTDYIQKIDLIKDHVGYRITVTMHDGIDMIFGHCKTQNAANGVMAWLRNHLGLKLFNDNQSKAN
jgi:hypothetical protein